MCFLRILGMVIIEKILVIYPPWIIGIRTRDSMVIIHIVEHIKRNNKKVKVVMFSMITK